MAGIERWRSLLVISLLLGVAPRAGAQLISPGKLSRAHERLEGIRHCTECHELRQRGITNARCLACHKPLAARIAARRGFHADLASKNCAECHKEHFGRDFAVLRFDTTGFDHRKTGFTLEGHHAELACRKCHRASLIADSAVRAFKTRYAALDQTFLGLGTTCTSCHRTDNPHGRQFGDRACTDCHTQRAWKGAARFHHDRTRFTLTGRHRRVRCDQCHQPRTRGKPASLQYVGIRFAACTDCHRDPHNRAMGAHCTRCHTTGGWKQLDRAAVERGFDHSTTGYKLVGAHARLVCAACHDRTHADTAVRLRFRDAANVPYPRPVATDCLSCHRDYHAGAFAKAAGGGAVCANCHTQTAWTPTTFDVKRHASTAFPLEGAHLAVPCLDCHGSPATGSLRFRFEKTTCQACHAPTNPHGTQFAGRACADCHTATTFRIVAFDHATTRFPLDGQHRSVPCASCHPMGKDPDGKPMRIYRPLGTKCHDCHAGTR